MRTEELLALRMFGRASRLSDRIEMLLKHGREFSPRASSGRVAGSAVVLVGLIAAGSLAPRWIAFAQQTQAPNPPAPQPIAAPVVPQPAASAKPSASAPQIPTQADDSLQTALSFYGYGDLSSSELVKLRTSGITADYVSRMLRSGLGSPGHAPAVPLDQLVQLQAAGVTPDDARIAARVGFPADLFLAFDEVGFPHLDPAQIKEAAGQGLHPGNVRRAKAYGSNLTLEEIIRLRDEHKLDQPDEN